MQVAHISNTYTPIQTKNVLTKNNTNLQKYLHSINWETTELSNEKLETMLVASCLRFLVGLADIDFVIGLGNEIREKYIHTLKLSLYYSTEILNTVSENLTNSMLLANDKNTLDEYIHDVLDVISKRKYYLSVPESEQS